MEDKIKEIEKTGKIEIFYIKSTKEFCGAGYLDGLKVNEYFGNKKVTDSKKLKCICSLVNKQSIQKKNIDKQFSKKEQNNILLNVEKIIDSVEVSFDEWCEFIKSSHDVIKVIDGKLISEKIPLTLKQLRLQRIKSRKRYLKETLESWFDDVDNIPQEIKNKRILAKQEINEIEIATEKTITNYSIEF